MAFNFPNPPLTVGQKYEPLAGVVYTWDGTVWGVEIGTGPTGPPGPPGPQGPQGAPGISAGLIFYCDATTNSDIAGYKKMGTLPSLNAETSIAVACTGVNVDFPVEEFATDAGVPGAVDYPAGTAFRRIYAKVDSGTARLHLKVYIRTAAGVETLVRDEYSPDFINQAVALQEWLASSSAAGILGGTDRLVAKLYAQRITGGGDTVTVTLYFEGTMHASHIQTTISASGGEDDVIGGIITISSTAPSSPAINDVWIDTT